ncbi:MAG: hypothetical protein K6U04_05600 [Armatimonadetes bacterium]|nr:hypothetical protein [Armatimonadota bacterium]
MEFIKDAVIGFLVTKVPYFQPKRGEPTHFVSARPVAFNWEGLVNEYLDLEEGETVIGVIPAPPGTYEVWGEMPDGTMEVLGYETPGAYTPDWNEVLEETAKRRTETKKRKEVAGSA